MAESAEKRGRVADDPDLFAALRDSSEELTQSASVASLNVSRTITYHVAAGWWTALVEKAASPSTHVSVPHYHGVLLNLDGDLVQTAASVGVALAGLPFTGAAAEIGRLYCFLLPAKHRSTNGVFYTPPPLVNRLLDDAEAAGHIWTAGKVIDPSCGGGAFMVAAAGRMARAVRSADPAIIIATIAARLRGWDLDPFAAWLSHLCVEAFLLPQVIASGHRLSSTTEVRNSLTSWEGHEGAYALVMGNPAFGKVKDDPGLRNRFRRSLYGHPNLYGLFTDLAVHLAAPKNGTIAYLTPTSYLGGQYFKALRRLLSAEAPPVSIAMVESRKDVFEDVLQEVALNVFCRGRSIGEARCSVIHVEPDNLRIEETGRLVMPANPESSWLMPRKAGDAPLVERMMSMPSRLSDWGYSVSTGPLVWNRNKPRLHNDARRGAFPVVWAEAIGEQGEFRLKPEKRHHAAFYQPRGPRDPNLVSVACLLLQRTTSKEQGRRLICALLPESVIKVHGAVAVENHLNMVMPTVRSPAVPKDVLAAFFASDTADRVIRCINASVALSASEIEAMPLPPPALIISAMAASDTEEALRNLYGIRA